MGYNYTGLAIDKNFDKNIVKLQKQLKWNLQYVQDIEFESGSTSSKDEKYIDIFFSDKGTLIYTGDPVLPNSVQSAGCKLMFFMVSETAMVFGFELMENLKSLRNKTTVEGDIKQNEGDPLELENTIEDNYELILKLKEQLFGEEFYSIDLSYPGKRYIMNTEPFKEESGGAFYDDSSQASNQGSIELNRAQWIKMNWFKLSKNVLFLILSFVAMVMKSWWFVLFFIPLAIYNFFNWSIAKTRFQNGDVNPGKVISLTPVKVAVVTNLSKYGGNYPVIRIFKTSLTKNEKIIGNIIPTISLYTNGMDPMPFWSSFMPVPMSHGTKKKEDLNYFTKKFTKESIETIDEAMKEIKTYQAGLYKLNIEGSNWKDYRDVKLGGFLKSGKEES